MNFGPLTADISWRVWGTPANFNGFRAWLRYCTDIGQRRSTKLCMMFGRLLEWYIIYKFLGALTTSGILPGIKFTLRPSLCSPILTALLHGTRTVGISQSLWRGTRKVFRELRNFRSSFAPPIFRRTAITLGIGPLSSFTNFVVRSILTKFFSNVRNRFTTFFI